MENWIIYFLLHRWYYKMQSADGREDSSCCRSAAPLCSPDAITQQRALLRWLLIEMHRLINQSRGSAPWVTYLDRCLSTTASYTNL